MLGMRSTGGGILQPFPRERRKGDVHPGLRRKSCAERCVGMSMTFGWRLTLMILLGMGSVSLAEEVKEIALFEGKSLENWKTHDAGGSGAVEAKNGELIIGRGESLSGVIYEKTQDLPQMNYEISLEAKRLDGLDFFVGLTFPVGSLKTCATLVMGGWGGSVTGISSIDDLDAAANATGHYRRYKDNQWYAVKLRVTPEVIKVWCDGELIINADIKGKKVGLRPGPIEEYAPLSLTTYQTEAAIRKVVLKPLGGKG